MDFEHKEMYELWQLKPIWNLSTNQNSNCHLWLSCVTYNVEAFNHLKPNDQYTYHLL
jgi:hypothetical protein